MSRGTRKLLVLAGGAIAVVVASAFVPVGAYAVDLAERVRGGGVAGAALFGLAYVVAAVLLVPGSVLTISAGFAYGLPGVAVAWPAATLASVLAFGLGRSLAREWVAQRVAGSRRFLAVDGAIADGGAKVVLLLRLSPIIPYSLLNYALGLTRVGVRGHAVATAVGMVPGALLYVYIGSLITNAAAITSRENLPEVVGWERALFWGGLAATAAATALVARLARRKLRGALADRGDGDVG